MRLFTAYSMDKRMERQFEKSFNEFAEKIFRYVYFRVSEYDLAKDLTEDTFVRYWKVLIKDEKVENHKALLYFIASGLIIDYYRAKKNSKKVSLENIDERLLSREDGLEDILAQEQELEKVYRKIKKLRKEYQEILLLHYLEDLSVKEIAFIQKKRENSIRVLLHRALKELKKKI